MIKQVCWAAVFALLGSLPAPALEEAERFEFADGLYSRDMFDLAAKEYEGLLRHFPDSKKLDVVHFRLGECYRNLGKNEAAEKEYRIVYDTKTSDYRFKAGFKRAKLLADLEKNDAALELFRAILKDSPPEEITAASLYQLADVQLKTGATDEGVRTLEDIRKRFPSSQFYPMALLRLGEIYGRDAAREKEALEYFNTVASKPPSPRLGAEAAFQVARMYFNRKMFDKSAEAYRKLLTDYPDDPRSSEAKIQAAWALHNAGLYAEGLKIAEDRLKAAPDETPDEWLYLKANCERQLMKNDEAIATYGRIASKYSDGPFAHAARYETALVYYKMGKYADAVKQASRIKLTPEIKKDVYWLLAESHSAMKDADTAIQYYRLLVKEFPKSNVAADATYRLAHHLQEKGDLKEAARFYGSVAENFKDDKLAPKALYASAFCHAKDGRVAEALRDWTALVRAYPNDPLVEDALYQKAMIETRQRKDKEALLSFRDLLKAFPKTRYAAEAHYWQGVFLSQEGKWQDAEEELRQALKNTPARELEREIHFSLAVVLQKTAKLEESAALLETLVTSPDKDKLPSDLVKWMTEFSIDRQKYSQALDAAKLLISREKEPEWVQTGWALAGRAYFAQDNLKDAETAFRTALAVKVSTPYAAEAAIRLADILMTTNAFDDARKHYETAARLAADESQMAIRARAYAGLGRAAKARKDWDSASRYFMSVAVLYNEADLVSECLFEASEAFTRLGRKEEGLKAAKELLQRYPDSLWAKKPEMAAVRPNEK